MGFEPGKSGNPGGRPEGIRSRVRKLVDLDEIIGFLLTVMRDSGEKTRDRLQAGSELMDRGWGKPHQSHSIDGEIQAGDTGSLTPEQRRDRIRERMRAFLEAIDDAQRE